MRFLSLLKLTNSKALLAQKSQSLDLDRRKFKRRWHSQMGGWRPFPRHASVALAHDSGVVQLFVHY